MIRVLLADDADDIRMLVRYGLDHDARFEVVGEARDGEEALELASTCAYDLLLLDLAMPRMDGLEVLERLRAKGDDSTVVVFSGFSADSMVERAKELGANGYVHKGTDIFAIPDILAEAAGHAA